MTDHQKIVERYHDGLSIYGDNIMAIEFVVNVSMEEYKDKLRQAWTDFIAKRIDMNDFAKEMELVQP